MARPFLYCCPTTGHNVQGYAESDDPPNGERRYEAVECIACGYLHMVNPATGKLASEESGR
jgi:hypothetical protein